MGRPFEDSYWFIRASSPLEGLYKVRELCTGIGGLGRGASCAGFQILVANEKQSATCAVLQRNSSASVVQGDLSDHGVLAAMWKAAPGPAGITSGFCCQPFSAFGDRKAQHDERSATLPGSLKAAHLLQAPFVLLECVTQAGSNAWVQQVLRDFCTATAFLKHEVLLELAHVWPCYRHRWWCLLVHPALRGFKLQAWSADGKFACIAQVVDSFQVSDPNVDTLLLTPYERSSLLDVSPCKHIASH